MLSRIKFPIESLVNEILDNLPADVWTSKTSTFLDPAMAGGQFAKEIERRLLANGHDRKNISKRVIGCDEYQHQVKYAVNKHKLVGQYRATKFHEQDFKGMVFDTIVGNPPYNREIKIANTPLNAGYIYIQIIIDSMTKLKDGGQLKFVLPTNWLTLKKFVKFRKWLSSTYCVDRIDILENLVSQKYFAAGTDVCVLTVTKAPPINNTVFSYEFGATWTVDLTKHSLWPLFTSQADYQLYDSLMTDPKRKTARLVRVADISKTNGKGYVTGNVVIGDKNSDFQKKWLINDTLPIKSEHSLNNQWALEFPTVADANDYVAYCNSSEFKQIIRTIVSGFKLQPYWLEHIGYR
jgi:hypothetical protein